MQARRLALLAALGALVVLSGAAPSARAAETGIVLGARANGSGADPVVAAGDLGAKWVRVFADWAVLEPADNQYDSGFIFQLTEAVRKFSARGHKVIVPVYNAPAWASGATDRITPPLDPGTYAAFVRELIAMTGGAVDAWEIWNEPDDPLFWRGAPDPGRYAAVLRTTYAAIKAADRDAAVVVGGLTGNNFDFVASLYTHGAKGSFDAIGVHTDTACLTTEPETFYREPTGNIGRFSFTGYREIRHVTVLNRDPKPIWLTELGWSTTPAICNVGNSKGKKPGGVSEKVQADFLKRAYHCLALDDYVQVALWFSLQDVSNETGFENRLGLIRDDGTRKPSYAAFRSVARDGDKLTKACGGKLDKVPPKVQLLLPRTGETYFSHLPVRATATDNLRVTKLELYADGVKVPGSQRGRRFFLDWQGSRRLSFGRHRISVRAYDVGGNTAEASTTVTRVDPAVLAPIAPAIELRRGRVARGFRVRVKGRLKYAKTPVKPDGRVLVEFQQRTKGSGYRTAHKFSKGTRKPFDFVAKLKGPGKWRLRATFQPNNKPFVRSRSRNIDFVVG